LHPHVDTMIVSGIPVEERKCFSYGELIEKKELEDWLCFKYKKRSNLSRSL